MDGVVGVGHRDYPRFLENEFCYITLFRLPGDDMLLADGIPGGQRWMRF
jgi:hypothetical protein